jgi:hypothetical protein
LINSSKCWAALGTKVFALFICSSSGNSQNCFPLTISIKHLGQYSNHSGQSEREKKT